MGLGSIAPRIGSNWAFFDSSHECSDQRAKLPFMSTTKWHCINLYGTFPIPNEDVELRPRKLLFYWDKNLYKWHLDMTIHCLSLHFISSHLHTQYNWYHIYSRECRWVCRLQFYGEFFYWWWSSQFCYLDFSLNGDGLYFQQVTSLWNVHFFWKCRQKVNSHNLLAITSSTMYYTVPWSSMPLRQHASYRRSQINLLRHS